MPAISVIMGVHNGGPYLAEAVASIQSQTMHDWELVLVENGSTDGAVDALESGNRDRRVRVLRFAEGMSPGGALALACDAARGAYLAVLDQDDVALPRRLQLQKGFLDQVGEVTLLGSATEVIDREGRPRSREPFVALHEDIYAATAYVHALRHSGVMFRRELLTRIRYRADLGAASDFDFFARAVEVGRAAALPVVLCRYRLHGHNETVRSAPRSAASGALARMLTRRRRGGQPEGLQVWAARFAAIVRDGSSEAEVHRACAGIFRSERHADLAALHAWLAWRAGGGWRAACAYFAAVIGGLQRQPAVRAALARGWLKEPSHQLLRAGGMPDRMQF